MRIERVDEKTVKCFLSNEELEEYEIDYKDFVMRSEKAKEVVQEIIEHAEEEVGYKPPHYAFDLQIMMLPDQGLILTFSERDPDTKEGDPLIECLKEMKRMLQAAREKVGMAGKSDGQAGKNEDQGGKSGGTEGGGETRSGAEKAAPPMPRPDFAVFVFPRLGSVMDYAAVLPSNLRMDSQLYEMNGFFYLCLKKGHASYERYSRACIQAMEFATLYTADEKQSLTLQEHGTCLISEKAVKKLRG